MICFFGQTLLETRLPEATGERQHNLKMGVVDEQHQTRDKAQKGQSV